jgi:hypothetical protein
MLLFRMHSLVYIYFFEAIYNGSKGVESWYTRSNLRTLFIALYTFSNIQDIPRMADLYNQINNPSRSYSSVTIIGIAWIEIN